MKRKKKLKSFQSVFKKKINLSKIKTPSLDILSDTSNKITNFYNNFKKDLDKKKKQAIKTRELEKKKELIRQKKQEQKDRLQKLKNEKDRKSVV